MTDMQPIPPGAFAHDAWFPVELSCNVPEGQVVQSMLHGQELALWRPVAGGMQAWENRCPHRSVRLTLGFVDGEQLVCRYHGWRYGSDGRCTGVPSTPALAPPPAACVRTFMCRESDGIAWASLARLPRGYPPALRGLAACRNFVLDGAAASLAESLRRAGFEPGEHAAIWRETGEHGELASLLLQPMDASTTGVHLFMDAPASSEQKLALARRMKTQLLRLVETSRTSRELSHA